MSKRSKRREARERAQMQTTTTTLSVNQQLDKVAGMVERATNTAASKQPRFAAQAKSSSLFASIYNLVRCAAFNDKPKQNASIAEWDNWYRTFALREPFLSGVLNSVVQIDKNRGWAITGGRNQVNRFTQMLHDADDSEGWRHYCSWQAQSYYTTRMGFVTELGREGDGGPVRALYSVDPCRCQLTGNVVQPLRYTPRGAASQYWQVQDFFRASSLPSTDEAMFGLGWPAIARCMYLAEILVAVYEHDQEQLGARAPKGLLLLHGIDEQQWITAMEAREESLSAMNREYYGGVAVLAQNGPEEIAATMVALSQLPKDFDMQKMTDLAMYGFALCFGYDAREFWPVSSGTLGTGNEVQVGHQKASSKGDLDFSLTYQEKLQREFPPSLAFEFERRDDEGEKLSAESQEAKARVITEINKWKVNETNVLSSEQILQLAAEAGIIPDEWTVQEEDVTATDTDAEQITQSVMRAAETFPNESIVRYSWPSNRTKVIARCGLDLIQRRSFPAAVLPTVVIERATIEGVKAQFRAALRNAAVLGFTTDDSILADVRRLIRDAVNNAYIAGLEKGGVTADEMDEEDSAAIAELIAEQLDYATSFCRDIRAAKDDRAAQRDILDNRIDLWANSIEAAGNAGYASAQRNAMGQWYKGATEQHCPDCANLHGQRHRLKWFTERNFYPRKPGAAMKCGGYACDCQVKDSKTGQRLL